MSEEQVDINDLEEVSHLLLFMYVSCLICVAIVRPCLLPLSFHLVYLSKSKNYV